MNNFPQWHEFNDRGEPFGPSVEMMRALSEQAGFRLRISEETPFVRCLRLMQLGETDLMTNLSYSDERAEYMHLIPYTYNDPDAFWLRKDSPMRSDPMAHAESIRLVTLRGSLRTPATNRVLSVLETPMSEVESWERAFDLVRVGRADAVLSPALSGYRIIDENARFSNVFEPALIKAPYKLRQPVHIGLSRSSPNADLVDQLKAAVRTMSKQERINRWFPRLGRRDKRQAKN